MREHPRARHVRLRVDPVQGLIVTVPMGFDRACLPALLRKREDWIQAAREGQQAVRRERSPALAGLRPQRVALPALDEEWQVEYRSGSRCRLRLQQVPGKLILDLPDGPAAQYDQRIAASLRAWLMARGREVLPQWTARLAARHGFTYRAVQVRNQRSRWGSCSSRGTLSLNARLLFCAPEACEYVLIHELVHTVHPDHSRAFWENVAELVPEHRARQADLRQVWLRLPDWI